MFVDAMKKIYNINNNNSSALFLCTYTVYQVPNSAGGLRTGSYMPISEVYSSIKKTMTS